jgi:hypothetical protein
MSFSYWWFSCYLSDADYKRLSPMASEARRNAKLRPEGEAAIALWREHPEMFELDLMLSEPQKRQEQRTAMYNEFIRSFNLPGYIEFGKELVATGFLSQETCFRFIITDRCSPVAALWHMIGYDRAMSIPGEMGNLFLSAGQVENALAMANHSINGLNLEETLERGKRFAGHSNDIESVSGIITHLSEGLSSALKIEKGFLAVARPQL